MKLISKRLRVSLPARLILPLLLWGFVGRSSTAMAQSPGTFTPTGSMRTARVSHTATLLPDGRVLIVGGQGPRPASAELYDPRAGIFTPTGNMTWARFDHTATLLNDGKVLVTGGRVFDRGGVPRMVGNAELYDPTSGTFSATGEMVGARAFHTATLLPDGKVLIAGGFEGFAVLAMAELYDPSTGTFTQTGKMTTGWFSTTANLLPDGKVLVAGGIGIGGFGPSLTGAELYDPVTGTFSPTGNLATPSYWHTATLLTNGKVLVAGGQDEEPIFERAELYDPSSGIFTRTGDMTKTRSLHAATLLPGGTVLITGGPQGYPCSAGSCFPQDNASAELYEPVTGTFSPTGRMTTARAGHTATLLNNGQVLIAGGWSGYGNLPSAELYYPPSGTFRAARNMAVGTSLIVPSAVYSDEFVSSLVILNIDNAPDNVRIYATLSGDSIWPLKTIALGVGERFRSTNILQQLGAPLGSSGSIVVSSTNGRLLSAVSEVSSNRGAAGFLPAVNPEAAWTEGFLLEAVDSGPPGMPGTYRTNLGLIDTILSTGSWSTTNVTMTLFNSLGQQVGNPLTVLNNNNNNDCDSFCAGQVNTIVQRLRGSAGVTEGHVRISSSFQPIIAWASKIENGTEDPSFQIGVGAASSAQQQIRQDVGTRLLVPSSAYSDTFTSSLIVLNMDSQPNNITITAFDTSGNPLAPPLMTTLSVGAQFRSSSILQQLGAAFGSFGPIKVESTNNRLFSAISEVRSNQGFAGAFSGVNVETAWTEGVILEAVDSGPRGTPTTHRTNLGLNAVSPGSTNVMITLFNDSGQQVGNSISVTVVANGLTQLDNIVQQLRGSADVTGGYLKIVSSQPIIAWASKVENGTDDPSFQIGIGVSSMGPLVDLNGTYLAPSSGARFSDAVASATTHPLGDRRGQGQVYEVNKGIPTPEGTYTPFSDDVKKPHALSGIDLRGKSFNAILTSMVSICGMTQAETARNSSRLAPDDKLIRVIQALKKSLSLYMLTDGGSHFIWRRTGLYTGLQRPTML